VNIVIAEWQDFLIIRFAITPSEREISSIQTEQAHTITES